MRVRALNLALLLVWVGTLASCGASSGPIIQPTQTAVLSATHTSPAWIISVNALHLLEQHGASTSLIEALFDNPHSYILTGPRQTDPLPRSIPVANFTSYQDVPASQTLGMASAFSRGSIQPEIKAISYDDENWPFTEAREIAQPVEYTQLASDRAHQQGFLFLSSPGMDLGTSATGQILPLPMSYERFVQDGYLSIARYDDVFELQLENIETETPTYVTLALDAHKRVKLINPKVAFFVQLTSNPNKQTVSAQELMNDYTATKGVVDGYALTLPDSAAICPACGAPNVQAMLTFLQALENQHTSISPSA